MNLISRILTLLILVSATIYFSACDGGKENEKSEKEVQMDKLVGTWSAQAVTYEGNDQMTDYQNFTIAITRVSSDAMTFTTTGRPGKLTPWDASGTFTFGNPVASKLVRGDDVTVTYTVSGSNLQLVLDNYSGSGYNGRTETVAGDWIFTLTK
jgi:hypothetical protein